MSSPCVDPHVHYLWHQPELCVANMTGESFWIFGAKLECIVGEHLRWTSATVCLTVQLLISLPIKFNADRRGAWPLCVGAMLILFVIHLADLCFFLCVFVMLQLCIVPN